MLQRQHNMFAEETSTLNTYNTKHQTRIETEYFVVVAASKPKQDVCSEYANTYQVKCTHKAIISLMLRLHHVRSQRITVYPYSLHNLQDTNHKEPAVTLTYFLDYLFFHDKWHHKPQTCRCHEIMINDYMLTTSVPCTTLRQVQMYGMRLHPQFRIEN